MGYISSPDHFINFINKTIKMSDDIDFSELLDAETYIDFIYKKNLQDKFSWAIKQNPCLLEHENLLKWIQKQDGIGTFTIPSPLEHIITAEFSDTLKGLNSIPGIYSFWTKKETPLYIGMSIDLQSRIVASFGERFNKYKRPIYLKYIATEQASDAAVLEVYFICKFKPTLNGTSKYSDKLSIEILNIPDFSTPILCNRVLKRAPL